MSVAAASTLRPLAERAVRALPGTEAVAKPHLAFVLPGLGAGGSEHIVSQLCNHFARAGCEVTLIAFEAAGTIPYYPHDPAVRIVPLGHNPRDRRGWLAPAEILVRTRALHRCLVRTRPDLIVSFLTRTNIMSVIAARGTKIPVLVSERNNPARQTIGPIWKALRRWTYRRSAGLVTMTRGALDQLAGTLPPRGWVIPNPATIPATIADRVSDGRTIGAVGRLVPQKGFDRLIDAFARAGPLVPDWHLVIWGEGPERPALEAQLRRLGLQDRVSLPGVTAKPGEWIARSDLFVLSSRFEGWGIVVGEAMAGGVPVIAFDCEWGPAEMIEPGDSGMLVPEGDVEALADAMAELCEDADRREAMGRAGRERMTKFAPDAVLAAWERVIGQVLHAGDRKAT